MVVVLSALIAAQPAGACIMQRAMDLNDVRHADIVVVGRIANYEVVADQAARQRRKELLARSPKLREMLRGHEGSRLFSDYARFDILVDEVLRGSAPGTLPVTWAYSTFPEPADIGGTYLIALHDPHILPPIRGGTHTVLANPEPDRFTILNAPCAGMFMFESTAREAWSIRQILNAEPAAQ
jgi:hypothetical protein